ncbi:HAD-IA family hydrolase [Kitasatospora paracochleata]|uniref:Phosphoglycolate phosphatase-like HAD superfamily hydrolase n=1 Tax=Kitasatospora paracochleata TaxID=58354 RepID=A0ABT1IY36_9ACTN|nr:HAD hydrolase-like protein [Kitasatospora paracochleata]MCP2310067.1 phosphoglycolate phosphatase-like HAD superfamily hydrolase [Kitasatospora paracochleata]
MQSHIVWDWNGTLLHDMEAVLGASNAAFATVGIGPMTLQEYREQYEIPIPRFYERLLGRMPTEAEWLALDGAFHDRYSELFPAAGLTEGALALLTGWRAAGRSQSLLSMYEHERLVPAVEGFGLTPEFLRVDGRTGASGGRKAVHLARHLAALDGQVDRRRTVLIGDAADDAEAALESGIHAVLYTGGSHSREKLAKVGVPVVDSLAEAVGIAERIAG